MAVGASDFRRGEWTLHCAKQLLLGRWSTVEQPWALNFVAWRQRKFERHCGLNHKRRRFFCRASGEELTVVILSSRLFLQDLDEAIGLYLRHSRSELTGVTRLPARRATS